MTSPRFIASTSQNKPNAQNSRTPGPHHLSTVRETDVHRVIDKRPRLPPDRTYQSSTLRAGPTRMNAWTVKTALARLLSINAVGLTGPPNSQVVGYSSLTR